MFTIRRPGRAQRVTKSAGHASPPRISNRTPGTSSDIIASSVGTHENTVTPASVSNRDNAGPACIISRVPTTSAAPA